MDKWDHLRHLPPLDVLAHLGVDISTFKKRSGKQEWYGRCPLPGHNPKQNSTSFSIHAEGLYQCFSCLGKGKGSIDLTKAIRRCGFQQAVEWLEGYKPPDKPQSAIVEPSSASSEPLKPFTGKYHLHQISLPWLENRCPDKTIRDRYGVFAYCNPARKSRYQNKVFIPLKDLDGTLYGYLVRTPEPKDGENKYEFPAGFAKSRFLFGAHELTRPDGPCKGHLPVKVLYLVESPFSVLKFASLGLPAVSPFGWSVSDEQLQLLRQLARGCVYIPDTNKYKDCASEVHRIAQSLWVRIPALPDGVIDPEYLSLEQIQTLTR